MKLDLRVPSSWSLLKHVESFVEFIHETFNGRLSVSLGLHYIHLLVKLTIEECGLHVQLEYLPTVLNCNSEEHSNGFKPCNRVEHLVEVYSTLPRITF